MTAVPGKSYAGPLSPRTAKETELAQRLRRHVEAIAREPHNIGHPEAFERSARYIETTLAGFGYQVATQRFDNGRARNIEVALLPDDGPGPSLVIGAHYDSAFSAPGANDNGSGVAALLELARMLADLKAEVGAPIRFVFFANEEPPFFQTDYMGSRVYAERLRASGEKVRGMWSLETLGYYDDRPGSQHYPFPLGWLYPDTGNFIAFVGTTGSRDFVRRSVAAFRARAAFPSVGGTAPGFVQGIDWSDHWAFEQAGFPALMITDTAPFRYPRYHSTADTSDKLDYARLARVVTGLEAVVRSGALQRP
ncbi:M20/M25/M40 family metallo-hydrolase [Sphingomonas naasensis]|uniref:M20/M25/M40 family metallo-hydrolase n=2 Tax=Sphingomonas naasensis TaxID=1344951 RepID=A0A4S1WY24_9SPHN|nr:M20/M25/M40 family metallo-hydrolase [Sphingomonas naasensis]